MEGLAEARAQAGRTGFEGALKSIRTQEKQHMNSVHIQKADGKWRNGG